MRIAILHSFYSGRSPSGENRVVMDQLAKLEQAGHEVHLVSRETEADVDFLYKLKTAVGVTTRASDNPTSELRSIAPDIVHIHNVFPNFGTSWTHAWPGPIVHTVHNFRAVCSNGLLFRDGTICEECPTNGDLRAVRHRCYKDSLVATTPVWLSRAGYRRDVLQRSNAVITTSERSDVTLKRTVSFDFQTDVIPNFGASDRAEPGEPTTRRCWLAMGRFEAEKGFLELIDSWPTDEELLIIGSGPLQDLISVSVADSGKNVKVIPSLPIDELRNITKRAFALIFPSRWLEVDPQVVVEAMRLGVPVVAFEVNAGAQVVEVSGGGAVYADRATLAKALEQVVSNRRRMSIAAMAFYESQWSPTVWLERIEGLYERVMHQSRFRSKHG